MKLTDYFYKEAVILDLTGEDYITPTKKLVEKLLLVAYGDASENKTRLEELCDPHNFWSSLEFAGVGEGVAIVEVRKVRSIDRPLFTIGISKTGLKWLDPLSLIGEDASEKTPNTRDGQPVYIVAFYAYPLKAVGDHLRTYIRMRKMLASDKYRKKLLDVKSADEIVEILREADNEYEKEEKQTNR